MGTSAPEVANEKSRLFGSFCEADNALCYRLGAERLYITPWGENSFRVTSTKCAVMPEERWALTEEVKPVQAQIRIEEMQASITNGRITAVINNTLNKTKIIRNQIRTLIHDKNPIRIKR